MKIRTSLTLQSSLLDGLMRNWLSNDAKVSLDLLAFAHQVDLRINKDKLMLYNTFHTPYNFNYYVETMLLICFESALARHLVWLCPT